MKNIIRIIHNALICVSLPSIMDYLVYRVTEYVHEKIEKPEPRCAHTLVQFKYQFPAGYDSCMCILRRSMQHHSSLPKLTMPSRQEAEHNHTHLSHKGYQPTNTTNIIILYSFSILFETCKH